MENLEFKWIIEKIKSPPNNFFKKWYLKKTELIIFLFLYHRFFFYEKSIFNAISDHLEAWIFKIAHSGQNMVSPPGDTKPKPNSPQNKNAFYGTAELKWPLNYATYEKMCVFLCCLFSQLLPLSTILQWHIERLIFPKIECILMLGISFVKHF